MITMPRTIITQANPQAAAGARRGLFKLRR
jgi:hypothetical protein